MYACVHESDKMQKWVTLGTDLNRCFSYSFNQKPNLKPYSLDYSR